MSQFQIVSYKFKELRISLTTTKNLNKMDLLEMIKSLPITQLEEIFTYENEMYFRLILDAVNKMQAILNQNRRKQIKILDRQVQNENIVYNIRLQSFIQDVEDLYQENNKKFDSRNISNVFKFWEKIHIQKKNLHTHKNVFLITPHQIIEISEWITEMMQIFDTIYPDFLTTIVKISKNDYLVMEMIQKFWQQETRNQFIFGYFISLIISLTFLYIINIEDKIIQMFQMKQSTLISLNSNYFKHQNTSQESFSQRVQIGKLQITCELQSAYLCDLDEDQKNSRRQWGHQYLTSELEDIVINNAFKLLSRGLGRRKMSYEVEKEKKHTISHSIFNRMEIHYDVAMQTQQVNYNYMLGSQILPNLILWNND